MGMKNQKLESVVRVLLVAEDDYFLAGLARIFSRAGHAVSAHLSARDAMREISRDNLAFDVFVTDLSFESVSSCQLLAHLSADGSRLFVLTDDVKSIPSSPEIFVYKKPSGLVRLMASIREVTACN